MLQAANSAPINLDSMLLHSARIGGLFFFFGDHFANAALQIVARFPGNIETGNFGVHSEFGNQVAAIVQNRLALDITNTVKMFQDVQDDFRCTGSRCLVGNEQDAAALWALRFSRLLAAIE